MTSDRAATAYLLRVAAALSPEFSVVRKPYRGREVLVGRRSDFRLRWFAVRLHTSVVLCPLDGVPTVEELDDLLDAAGRDAREAHPRSPIGLQVATAAVAVAVLPHADEVAREWAAHAHGHRLGSVPYPVAVDLGARTVIQPSGMRAGRAFAPFLRQLVADVVDAPLR